MWYASQKFFGSWDRVRIVAKVFAELSYLSGLTKNFLSLLQDESAVNAKCCSEMGSEVFLRFLLCHNCSQPFLLRI